MAKVYICDKCGHEERYEHGIFGKEYDYNKFQNRTTGRRHFETLIPSLQRGGIIDLCDVCFGQLQDASNTAAHAARQSAERAFLHTTKQEQG